MNCSVPFPWFPIKNIMKHLVQKNRIVLLVVLMRENHFWHHYLTFPTNPKRKAALCPGLGCRPGLIAHSAAPHRSVLHVQAHGNPSQPCQPRPRRLTFPSHQLSFPGSPPREKVDGKGAGQRGETIYKWLILTCVS